MTTLMGVTVFFPRIVIFDVFFVMIVSAYLNYIRR
ncbi:hypothetical protein LINPERPRIM_LOCUS38051 [Linum perenne]